MDQRSFDRIARLLGGAATRRAGLQAAIGGLLGLTALEDAAARGKNHGTAGDNGKPGRKDRGKGDGRGHDRRPRPEGPCGNGSRKDNACLKNSECCTGLCNTKRARKNTDGKGRCRCIQRGRACSEDRNCCNTMSCKNGLCGEGKTPPTQPVPTSEPCRKGVDTCADAAASCTVYDTREPAGTFCLIPFQGACQKDADCENASCSLGVCVTCSCSGCPTGTCEPDVCASGCTHSTIQAAINAASSGDVIRIAPGTYSEDITWSGPKDIALVGCPGGEVILKNATYGKRAIDVTDFSELQLVDIVVEGYNDVANSNYGGGVSSKGDVWLCRFTVLRNNHWDNAISGEGGAVFVDSYGGPYATLRILDGTLIENNSVVGNGAKGGGASIDTYCNGIVDNNAIIRNNVSDSYGGGIATYYKSLLYIRGKVQILDNTALKDEGGGVWLYGYRLGLNASITGDVLIRGNSASSSSGSGGGIAADGGDKDGAYIEIGGNVVIDDNTAGAEGGGGVGLGSDMTLYLSGNVKITNNKATTGTNDAKGGGVYVTAQNNTLPYILEVTDNVEISGNSTDSYGGGVWSDGPVRLSGNVVISNNTGKVGGGGIYMAGGSISQFVKITGNSTDSYGGGIYCYDPLKIVGDVEISGNSAGDGGGIWLGNETDPSAITGNVRITGNTTKTGGAKTSGKGAGIYNQGAPLTIGSKVLISGNTAAAEGGGLALIKEPTISTPATVVFAASSSVTGNTATSGGGIWSDDAGNTVTGGSVVTGNTPDNCVGATC